MEPLQPDRRVPLIRHLSLLKATVHFQGPMYLCGGAPGGKRAHSASVDSGPRPRLDTCVPARNSRSVAISYGVGRLEVGQRALAVQRSL